MYEKDGGPAFPSNNWKVSYGMSLRDWFAGQALIGLLTKFNWPTPTDAAGEAFRFADAMLEARKKVSESGD